MTLLKDFVRSAHLPCVALLSVEGINANATHILENRREYGTKENTLQLLKARYIKNNNLQSAYALHILHNRHE